MNSDLTEQRNIATLGFQPLGSRLNMFFSSVLQSKAEEIDEGFAYCGRRHEAAQGAALHGTGTLAYVIKHKMAW